MSDNFSNVYLTSLPSEPLLALLEFTAKVISYWIDVPEEKEEEQTDYLLEAFSITKALAMNVEQVDEQPPILIGSEENIRTKIIEYIYSIQKETKGHGIKIKALEYDNKYISLFGSVFIYEFTEGDLEKIQILVNELRDEISASTLFAQEVLTS